MHGYLIQFDAKKIRKSLTQFFFCQIDVEISKATIKSTTKQLKIGQIFRFVVLELVVGSSECNIYFQKTPGVWQKNCFTHTLYS